MFHDVVELYEVTAPTETELRRIVRCRWWKVWDELGWWYRGTVVRRLDDQLRMTWHAVLEFGHEDEDEPENISVTIRLGRYRSSRPILDELSRNLGVIVLARYEAHTPITDDPHEDVGLTLVSG